MKTQCILCVEDDEDEAYMLRYAFREVGVEQPVHFVADGQQAIAYLHGATVSPSSALLPCLVLLDLNLPGKSGLEVLAWIRAQPALTTLVVIVYSSSDDPRDLARAYRLRANAFVSKPPDLAERLEFVRLLKGWWLEYNRWPIPQHRPGPVLVPA